MERRSTWTEADGRAAALLLAQGRDPDEVTDWRHPDCVVYLDLGVRRLSGYEAGLDRSRPWHFVLASRAETALCHYDGLERHAALRHVTTGSPLRLSLTVVRCADWAAPVRARARRVLARVLAEDPASALRHLTPVVLRIGRRVQGGWAVELFEEALRDPAHAGVLAELRASTDRATARCAARITLEAGLLDARELAALAAHAVHDPLVQRLWTDGALARLAADGPDERVTELLLGARSGHVRAAGVTSLRAAGRQEQAYDHLDDPSGLVRACARWLVGQAGGEPRARYLELCADPARVSGAAVTGLTECGQRGDAPVLRALLAHPDGRVRAAALAGLRELGTVTTGELLPLLDDPYPAVTREAAVSLASWAAWLPVAELTARIAADRPSHTRRAAFRLLRTRGGMDGLRAAVAMLTDREPALRSIAGAMVRDWHWEAALRTAGTDPAELEELFRRAAPAFDGSHRGAALRTRLGFAECEEPEEPGEPAQSEEATP
ncbi:HEAT repeat domain-containing protein [Streptomyces sp. NPDC090022]|uniref:HEAT repeat domain-containing protein n=1 Tax=Streptomyces sp. NPDC090022 TaxID=3365920 RepID=UPI003802FD2A